MSEKGPKSRVFCSSQARKSHCRRRKRKSKEEERSRKEKEKKTVVTLLGFILATLEIIFVRNGEIGIGAFQILIV